MNGEAKTRDVGVELMRIFGCLIVIGCHTYLPIRINDTADTSRALVGMFCADGVAIFWLILGFFLFQQKRVDKLWRHTASHILVPMILFIIFSFYFFPWISGSELTLRESLCKSKEEYVELLDTFICWKAPNGVGHLWYLYVYILLIFLFPALNGVVQSMEKDNKLRVIYLIGFALILIDNVFSNNKLMAFSHHSINGVIPASILVIYGHFIYKFRSVMERYGIYAPLFFLVMNAVRTMLYLKGYTTIIYWYTCSGILGAVCVFAFSISLVARLNSNRIKSVILYLSSLTFSIYLLHFYAIRILSRMHFQATLLNSLSALPDYLIDLLYVVIMALTVFCVSLLFAVINRLCGHFFKRLRAAL